MIGSVTYLCSDGIPHVFDASQRQVPICKADVFVVGAPSIHGPLVCEDCANELLDRVEGLV